MTTDQKIETLISSLDETVKTGLAYFESNADSEDRVGIWTPREVLCHMIYWHQATVEGMETVASGGEPHRIYASTDEMNARAVGRASGKSVPQLIEELRPLQERLVSAARSMSDPNTTVLIRGNGSELSAAQRLELITSHWNEHLKELRDIAQ